MTDRRSFLASILAARDEADLERRFAPRLVYADWLDENGDCAQAELIRVGVELAMLVCHQPHCSGETTPRTTDSLYCNDSDCDHCHGHGEALRRRHRELIALHRGEWWPWKVGAVCPECNGAQCAYTSMRGTKVDPCLDCNATGRTPYIPEFVGGFVERVECARLADWIGRKCQHCIDGLERDETGVCGPCDHCDDETIPGFVGGVGRAIMERHPLIRSDGLTFGDKKPLSARFWFDDRRNMEIAEEGGRYQHYLPACIFDRLKWTYNYQTETSSLDSAAAANAALSEAAMRVVSQFLTFLPSSTR